MGALATGAMASIIFVLSVSINAYALVQALRALGLGGAKATFWRAVVVVLCAVPFGFALGAFTHYAAEAAGLGAMGELGLSIALSAPLHMVVFRKGFDLQAADALVLVVVLYISLFAFGVALSLCVGLVLYSPLAAFGIGVVLALTGWVTRARRHELEQRLNAVLLER